MSGNFWGKKYVRGLVPRVTSHGKMRHQETRTLLSPSSALLYSVAEIRRRIHFNTALGPHPVTPGSSRQPQDKVTTLHFFFFLIFETPSVLQTSDRHLTSAWGTEKGVAFIAPSSLPLASPSQGPCEVSATGAERERERGPQRDAASP